MDETVEQPPVAEVVATGPRRPGLSVGLGALGGAAMFAGALLTWVSVDLRLPRRLQLGFSSSMAGWKLADGRVVLGLGVGLVLLAFFAWAAPPPGLRGHAIVALMSGVVAGTVAITNLASNVSVPGLTGGGPLSGRISQLLERSLSVSKGPGLWVALAGALLAILAGAMDLLGGMPGRVRAVRAVPPRPPAAEPPPTPGSGTAPPHAAPTEPIPAQPPPPPDGARRGAIPAPGHPDALTAPDLPSPPRTMATWPRCLVPPHLSIRSSSD